MTENKNTDNSFSKEELDYILREEGFVKDKKRVGCLILMVACLAGMTGMVTLGVKGYQHFCSKEPAPEKISSHEKQMKIHQERIR